MVAFNSKEVSQELGQLDSSRYRNIICILVHLSRDRVDIMFTMKELATDTALTAAIATLNGLLAKYWRY